MDWFIGCWPFYWSKNGKKKGFLLDMYTFLDDIRYPQKNRNS